MRLPMNQANPPLPSERLMPSSHARRLVRWLPVLALVAGVAVGVPGSQAAPGGTLTLTPTQAAPGEPLHFVGSLPTAVRRPIVVQRGMYGNWIDLQTRHTDNRGRFNFRVPKNGMPSDPYRVMAPRTTVGGHTYAAVATPVRTVVTLEPDVEIGLSSSNAAVGRTVTLDVDATPARPGRPLLLQRRVSPTVWRTVVLAVGVTEDKQGEGSFTLDTLVPGTSTYRVVAADWKGAGWYPSFPVTLTVTQGRTR